MFFQITRASLFDTILFKGRANGIRMIYTELTKKALKLSFEAHKNQIDKSGMPYVYHPFHLAEQMHTEEETIVALLHDVVEDTDYSIEDIKASGFSDQVIEALALMTHDKSIPYMEYIKKIKSNYIAKAVKVADLKHNSDLSRLDIIDGKAIERVQKYADAVHLLAGEDYVVNNLVFFCYGDQHSSLGGSINDGCLHIESKVYGEDYDSEKHYSFSKDATLKLFSLISLDSFIELCKKKHIGGLEKYLSKNHIAYESITI